MKKIISVAVLSALALSANAAEVDVYGKVRVGLESGKAANQTVLDGNNELKNNQSLQDWGSYIGFKGQENLGDGLKALWQIEQNVNITDNGGFSNRETFVGLENKVGSLKLGRLNNFTKSDLSLVDNWEYGTGVNGLRSFGRFDGQVNNAVRADAQLLPGLKVAALYGFDKTRDYNGVNRENNTTANLGATYNWDENFVGYSYLTQKGIGDGNVTSKVHRLEAGTKVAGVSLNAGYQQATNGLSINGSTVSGGYFDGSAAALTTALNGASLTDGKVKTKEYALTASYELGNVTPKISYAVGSDMKVDGVKAVDTGYQQLVVGADYTFSKRTSAQVSLGLVKSDAALAGTDHEKTFSVGLVHRF